MYSLKSIADYIKIQYKQHFIFKRSVNNIGRLGIEGLECNISPDAG